MAAISSRAAVLKVSVTAGGAGTYTTVVGIKSISSPLSAGVLDVTELPATFIARIVGLKDAKLTASGTYQPADTNGQLAIRSAWLNDSELWYQHLPDGSTGIKQQCRVLNFTVSDDVAGAATVSFELEGTGTVSFI